MLSTQTFEERVTLPNTHQDFSEINRLLAAAVVSSKFCTLLLNDPARAIAQGFTGEHFFLSPAEYDLVLSVRGKTLQEFAVQLCEYSSARSTMTPPASPSHQIDSYLTMV